MKITLPRWYDLHAHFRQGALLAPLLADHYRMGCAGILAMPNTRPPVAKVHESDHGDGWSIESYLAMLRAAGGDSFDDIIVPLYLTAATTPAMIARGAESGLLRACKYYPPHGTTGAEHGAALATFMENGVLAALAAHDIVLCVHGEEHDMRPEDYFDRAGNAEEFFYRERLPRVIDAHPGLRIVAEHVTTAAAVRLVDAVDNVAASITPQHLLYTAGHLLRGFKYHLYCLPLLKFEEDRAALRAAVTSPDNRKFFAGTDSAPHSRKATPCGCAAGCYTGGIAPQLYAQAFEEAGLNLATAAGQTALRRFLCETGPSFYRLPPSHETFTLERQPQTIAPLPTPEGDIVPLPLGMHAEENQKSVTLPWRISDAP